MPIGYSNQVPVTLDSSGNPLVVRVSNTDPETGLTAPTQTQDTNGEGAVRYITDTTPVTGLSARQVVCLTDTKFTTFTRTNSTGSIINIDLPAGTLLIGPVTAITLTSGAVAAYN